MSAEGSTEEIAAAQGGQGAVIADGPTQPPAQPDGVHDRGAGMRFARRLADSPEIGIIAALAAAIVVFTSLNPLFAQRQ